MVHNVEAILSRGERIELLVDKTDNLSSQARAFRKRSVQLRRRMWWKNTRLIALTGVVVLVRPVLIALLAVMMVHAQLLVYLILASACGATLSHCRS